MSLLVVVIDEIIRRAPRGIPQPLCHLCEPFRLDEVVECEGREHGSVAVDFGFDEEGGAAHAVELDRGLGVARGDFCLMSALLVNFMG